TRHCLVRLLRTGTAGPCGRPRTQRCWAKPLKAPHRGIPRPHPAPGRSRSIPGFVGDPAAINGHTPPTGIGRGGVYNAPPMNAAPTSAPTRAPAPAAPSARLPLVLVTGLSGAGHSTALRALEDLGYEAVDNLPLALLNPPDGFDRPVAIAVDCRTRGFSSRAL